jgi:hypothetical protein
VQHLTERHRFELCVQSLFHQLLESRNLVVHFRVSFAQISVSLLLLISTRLRDSDVPELPKAILILVRTDDVEQINISGRGRLDNNAAAYSLITADCASRRPTYFSSR